MNEFFNQYSDRFSEIIIPKEVQIPIYIQNTACSSLPQTPFRNVADCYMRVLMADKSFIIVVADKEDFDRLKAFNKLLAEHKHAVIVYGDTVETEDFMNDEDYRNKTFFYSDMKYHTIAEKKSNIFTCEDDGLIIDNSKICIHSKGLEVRRYGETDNCYTYLENTEFLGTLAETLNDLSLKERFQIVLSLVRKKDLVADIENLSDIFIVRNRNTQKFDFILQCPENSVSEKDKNSVAHRFLSIAYAIILGIDCLISYDDDETLNQICHSLKQNPDVYPSFVYEDIDNLLFVRRTFTPTGLSSTLKRMSEYCCNE